MVRFLRLYYNNMSACIESVQSLALLFLFLETHKRLVKYEVPNVTLHNAHRENNRAKTERLFTPFIF